jgi:hypothetical protein
MPTKSEIGKYVFTLPNGLRATLYTNRYTKKRMVRLAEKLISQLIHGKEYSFQKPIGVKNYYLIEIAVQHEKVYLVYLWAVETPSTTPEDTIAALTKSFEEEVKGAYFWFYRNTLHNTYEIAGRNLKNAVLKGVKPSISALLETPNLEQIS